MDIQTLLVFAPIIVAAAVKCVEIQGNGRINADDMSQYCECAVKGLVRFAPEVLGLLAFALFAGCLLTHGKHHGFAEADADLWEEMVRGWPTLISADSLFVLQGMIRIVVLLSVCLRAGMESTALSNMAAALFLLSSLCRLVLFALSPAEVYHIDGPLGGVTSILVEVAAVPMLLFLSRGILRHGRIVGVVATALLAALVAQRNKFSLADAPDAHLDTLFSVVQVLDFFAACAFLRQTCTSNALKPANAAASFAYVMLPLQQLLPAYFFFTAFTDSRSSEVFQIHPELVRSGKPFQLMWAIGFAQLVLYTIAGVFHFGVHADETNEKSKQLMLEPFYEV
jgi:hypothetical protein